MSVLTKIDNLSMVHIACWHHRTGDLRKWLRLLCPNLPDRPLKQISKILTPCITDLESFLLGLVLELTMSSIGRGINTVHELLLANALTPWKPLTEQVRIWQTLLRYSSVCQSF